MPFYRRAVSCLAIALLLTACSSGTEERALGEPTALLASDVTSEELDTLGLDCEPQGGEGDIAGAEAGSFSCSLEDSTVMITVRTTPTSAAREKLIQQYAQGQGEAFATVFEVTGTPALALSATEEQATQLSRIVGGRVIRVGDGAPVAG